MTVIDAVDGLTCRLDHSPIAQELALSDGVSTGAARLPMVDGLDIGVWEHSIGVSTDTEACEVFVVISGRGRVTCEQGGVIDLAPGVVGFLQAGARTRWEVTEPLRKVWVARGTDPAP